MGCFCARYREVRSLVCFVAEGVFLCNITVPKFLFFRRDKTKSMTPRIISVSGADSVQTCLVLGLPCAQINLSIRNLSCASSLSPQASLFFLPW